MSGSRFRLPDSVFTIALPVGTVIVIAGSILFHRIVAVDEGVASWTMDLSDHIVIRSRLPRPSTRPSADDFERELQRIVKFWKIEPPEEPVEVLVFAVRSELEKLTGEPLEGCTFVLGSGDDGPGDDGPGEGVSRIAIVDGIFFEIGGTIIHELTHVCIRGHLGGALPRGLSEGIATYTEARLELDAPEFFEASGLGTSKRIEVRDVLYDERWDALEGSARMHSYAHAGAFVHALLEEGGTRRFLRFCSELLEKSPDEAFAGSYETTLDAWQTEWRASQ